MKYITHLFQGCFTARFYNVPTTHLADAIECRDCKRIVAKRGTWVAPDSGRRIVNTEKEAHKA